MTHNESFPGRPRGRRARQDNGGSEWQGYDAEPPDQREFPDLAPIRPRGARERDTRAQGQPMRPGQQGSYGGYPGAAGPGYPGGGQAQADGGYGGGRYAGGGYSGQGLAPQAPQQPGQPQPGQPQPGQAQPGQAQPGQPQPGQAQPGQGRPGQQAAQSQAPPGQADEMPSWAEPASAEAFSERWRRRGLESRDEQRASMRKHRRLLTAVGTVVALAIAVTIYLFSGGPGAANLGFGDLVTTFLPGELQQVPNPCSSIPTAMLHKYLPGKTKQAAPPLNSGAYTECTWTLDSSPTYRVLQVQLQAYSPSGLASGNGSATFAAEDAFQSLEKGFAKPGPKSGQAPATVTDLSGMPGGSDTSAFQATEVAKRGGATVDVANVLVRYRNVIITVVVDGLNQDSGGKTYTTSMHDLTVAANTVAKEMASQIAK